MGYLFNECGATGRCGGANGDAYSDPETPASLTVVYDGLTTTHIGFHLSMGGKQMVYDPNGNYANFLQEGDAIFGKNASLSKFVDFQYQKGSQITVFTMQISSRDASAIFSAASTETLQSARGPTCAIACARLLSSAPTFSELPKSSSRFLPWTLQRTLRDIRDGGR